MKIKFLMVVVGEVLAACGDSATSTLVPPPEPNAVAYNAVDYAFAGPASLPSGLTEISFTSQGTELHHQQIISLPEGMTATAALTIFAESAEEDPPPPGVDLVGGVSLVAPGVGAPSPLTLLLETT